VRVSMLAVVVPDLDLVLVVGVGRVEVAGRGMAHRPRLLTDAGGGHHHVRVCLDVIGRMSTA
jgi:hypothetical protein